MDLFSLFIEFVACIYLMKSALADLPLASVSTFSSHCRQNLLLGISIHSYSSPRQL
jgi:hypothetical protein